MAKLAIMAMDKSKYTIVKERNKEYILASEAVKYAQDKFGTVFGIPSHRTLRFYATEGIIERPLKLGKEVYYELDYIMNVIELLRMLRSYNPSLNQIKSITLNIRHYDQFERAMEILEGVSQSRVIQIFGKDEVLLQLAKKRPTDIKVIEIERKVGESSISE